MDLKKFIVPITLENTNKKQQYGDTTFRTQDLIYLDNDAAVEDMGFEERVSYPTDYAVMNGAVMSCANHGPKRRKSCITWCRSGDFLRYVNYVNFYGGLANSDVSIIFCSLRPCLQLNLASVISSLKKSSDNFKISEYNDSKETKYHTIEFGEYPKTYVGNKLNKYLERAMSTGTLVATGKKYTGHFDDNGIPAYNE